MVIQGSINLCLRMYWVYVVYMRIISWNDRGLGSKKKRSLVKRFLRSQEPNIEMLQETKTENWDKRFLVSVWRRRDREWANLSACRAPTGVVIIWDSNKFECIEKVLGSFSVSVKLKKILFG